MGVERRDVGSEDEDSDDGIFLLASNFSNQLYYYIRDGDGRGLVKIGNARVVFRILLSRYSGKALQDLYDVRDMLKEREITERYAKILLS